MKGLVLGNIDYRRHMTDEGDQLQKGLVAAGWAIGGVGFDDGCADVPTLIERHQPDVILVQDRRDWDPSSRISFRKDLGFTNLQALRRWPGPKIAVFKDAGTFVDEQRRYFVDMGVDTLLVYYHPDSIVTWAPWVRDYRVVRTWHTVDGSILAGLDLTTQRKMVVVSGAVGNAYPLRQRAINAARAYGWNILRHPGYGNRGSATPEYLNTLSGYKVHIATASRFGFALRKIIESVAVGAIPITNLPEYDVLPEIDGALVRVDESIPGDELRCVVERAANSWPLSSRIGWAIRAATFYNWRSMGRRNSEALLALAGVHA